jgi:hypothetical protein
MDAWIIGPRLEYRKRRERNDFARRLQFAHGPRMGKQIGRAATGAAQLFRFHTAAT